MVATIPVRRELRRLAAEARSCTRWGFERRQPVLTRARPGTTTKGVCPNHFGSAY